MKNDRTTFNELFVRYVIEVQDEDIELEISFMLKNNVLNPKVMENMINLSMKGLQDGK